MSRKIKVRAWDEDCEVMYYSDKENEDCRFGFHEGRVVAWLRETEPQTLDEPAYDYGKLVEVEELVGLKDKEDVEIYEGDIVKEKETDYTTYIGPIIFESASFWFNYEENRHKSLAPIHLKRLKKMEVIGNIHQHPELLEKAAIAKGTE